MILLIASINDEKIFLTDCDEELISFDNEDQVFDFLKHSESYQINPKLKDIPISEFKISYSMARFSKLPDFFASKYEDNAVDYTILDSVTGEILSDTYRIVVADSNCGFFVARYGDSMIENENEYILHINKNMVIIKDIELSDIIS